MRRGLVLVFFCLCTNQLIASDERAHVNYKLHCQGCHMPTGEGALGAVPRLKNFVGYFLHSPKGRDFIAQVPGVTMSSLNNADLSELLNWLVKAYSADQLPEAFVPYSAKEIASLRQSPNNDPLSERIEILDAVAETLPVLATEIETHGYAY